MMRGDLNVGVLDPKIRSSHTSVRASHAVPALHVDDQEQLYRHGFCTRYVNHLDVIIYVNHFSYHEGLLAFRKPKVFNARYTHPREKYRTHENL